MNTRKALLVLVVVALLVGATATAAVAAGWIRPDSVGQWQFKITMVCNAIVIDKASDPDAGFVVVHGYGKCYFLKSGNDVQATITGSDTDPDGRPRITKTPPPAATVTPRPTATWTRPAPCDPLDEHNCFPRPTLPPRGE